MNERKSQFRPLNDETPLRALVGAARGEFVSPFPHRRDLVSVSGQTDHANDRMRDRSNAEGDTPLVLGLLARGKRPTVDAVNREEMRLAYHDGDTILWGRTAVTGGVYVEHDVFVSTVEAAKHFALIGLHVHDDDLGGCVLASHLEPPCSRNGDASHHTPPVKVAA